MMEITSAWQTVESELKAFVYKRVKDKALTDDIVQDVFVKMYTHIDQVKDTEKITAWIYQITRNIIVDHFRRQSKPIILADIESDSEQHDLNDCVSSCLKEMLQTLPEKYREAIELTEFHNLSQLQLAERLGISYSGTKSRVQRARQMLKERMDQNFVIRMDNYGNVTTCGKRQSISTLPVSFLATSCSCSATAGVIATAGINLIVHK